MAHDVFISYSQKDKPVADSVCAGLEAAKIRCWVAPRDIISGRDYAGSIVEAIHNCSVFVLIFSSESNVSQHVLREVERAVNDSKIIVPFRIEDSLPTKSMEYFISGTHWLDAYTEPLGEHIDKLVAVLKKLIDGIPEQGLERAVRVVKEPPAKPVASVTSYWQKLFELLKTDFRIHGALAVLLGVITWYCYNRSDPYFSYYLISGIICTAIFYNILKNSSGRAQRASIYAFCVLISALVTIAVIWRGIAPGAMDEQNERFFIPYFMMLGGFAYIIFSSIQKYTDPAIEGNRRQITFAIAGMILYLLLCRLAWEMIDLQVFRN